MITVVSRPQGHKLTEQELSGSISNSGGQAMVTTLFAHGLTDGQYIYIQSNIESYNGFKVVDSTAYNTFTIGEYKQDADIVYRISVLDHGWQCVHLPIVYELESDLYPTNTVEDVYTPNTVVSQSNNEGYTQLELSAALRDPTELSWVKIGTEVYQIITVLQPWSIVINLVYNAANTFGPVVTYYKNYCINVNIYAGLPAGHRWELEKPYELAATLQLIPDDNNQVKFSINEILRGYINVRNNLTLDTLPNNLDFMVAFKIGYFESYDETDGQEITTFTGTETVDSFEGYAVNAKLPFKEGSFLSDYINEDTYLARWLTIQDHPIAIVGRYFDLSFLLIFSGISVDIAQNGIIVQTIANPGLGVIRVPLDFASAGEYCIQVYSSIGQAMENTDFANNPGPDEDWATGASPSVTIVGANDSDLLWAAYPFIPGNAYEVTVNYHSTAVTLGHRISVQITDNSFVIQFANSIDIIGTSGNADSEPVIFIATASTTRIAIQIIGAVFGSTTVTINQVGVNTSTVTFQQVLLNSSFDDSSVWVQSGSGPSWAVGGGTADIAIITSDSKVLEQSFTGTVAGDYVFELQRISSNFALGVDSASLGVTFYDEDGNLIGSASTVEFISGNNNIITTHPFTTTVPVRKVEIVLDYGAGADMDVSLLYATLVAPTAEASLGVALTEEICITALEECDNTLINADGIRLLEDGDYRLLE